MFESLLAGPSSTNSLFILLILLWTLPWKGLALWKSAKNEHKWWFIALLVLNTMAVLEIIYIFFFSKKKEMVERIKEKVRIKEDEDEEDEED
jgi:4-amino-4-deoxy-L-arabinose transferase-like glycosyltransferase